MKLYKVKMKYIRNLKNIDKTNNILSVSSQRNKHNRLFLGIVVMVDQHKYCIPLSSVDQKEKYDHISENITLRKIRDSDGKVIGILNINNMIPVREEYLMNFAIDILPTDNEKQKNYKLLCRKELEWCNQHSKEITRLAQELHQIICSGRFFSKRKICPDYRALERECDKAKIIN